MGGFAWVTLATNDSYSLGALVLANSLRRVNTAHQLVVLITPSVTEAMRTQLSAVFNVVKLVDVLDSQDADNLALLARPELGITFTKLHCWRLTEFEKCVFLDADTLVLQNSDELFEREELSAAPDAGWPDCFNSGVFVYRPSNDTFKSLIEFALVHGSFDGGDQGLLNLYFSDWATKDIKKHLPFVYNMCSTATYSYLPAFKQFGKGLKIVHFIGAAKPWLQPFNTETGLARVSGESQHVVQFVQLWWDLFCTTVHPSLSTEMAGLAGALASVSLGIPLSEEQTALTEHMRRQGWEQGNIDYMGKDSFANIWQKICDTLGTTSSPAEEVPAPVAPVAAPVYVSSVEISPEGPVDTSPPASYAPVSAPKPVVASDNETAFKASQAETAAVIPEPKSPSVTEVVSLEPRVSSTTAADTSASAISAESPSAASPSVTPATPTEVTVSSVISSEAPVKTSLADSVPVVASPVEPLTTSSQIPVTPAPVTVAPVQLVPVATEVVTVPSGIPVPQEAPVTPQETLPLVPTEVIALLPTEAKPTAVVTKETPTVLKEEPAIVLTGVPVADAIDTPSPTLSSTPGPVSLSQILTQPLDPLSLPTSLVTDVPNNPSVVSTQAEVPAPVVSPQAEVPTPVFSPQAEVPTPVDSPQAEVPTPVVSPQAEVPVSVASPQAEVPTPVDSPQAEVPVSVSSPQAEVPAPVVSPKAEGPTPVVSPQAEGPTPVVSPKAAVPAPVVSPQAEGPASVVSPQAEGPAPVVSPQAEVPAPVVSPQAEVPASVVSPQAEGPAPMSPQTIVPSTPTDAKTTAPLIPQVTASEMITPASSPLSDVLVSQPLNLLTKIISTVTTQPGTPTVTEPTPPTSPPAVPIESPLATKLLVEAEIPGTPPAGACSSEPSLATTPADEPPIPPKRKGGSKSQTSQNQKGGKQGKGKK